MGEPSVRNIEKAINSISEALSKQDEQSINKEWFDSVEAIELFRQLIEKIQFEDDDDKSNSLSKIYAVSGLKAFSNDPNKFAVLRKVSELTTIQKRILNIVSIIKPEHRKFDGGSLTSSSTAIWFDQIMVAVQNNPLGKFWEGTLLLDAELEILESSNVIRRYNAPLANKIGYQITGLGKLVISYLDITDKT